MGYVYGVHVECDSYYCCILELTLVTLMRVVVRTFVAVVVEVGS